MVKILFHGNFWLKKRLSVPTIQTNRVIKYAAKNKF